MIAKRLEAEADDGAALEKAGLRRMLDEKEILKIIPISGTTLWRMQKRGLFPKATFISPNKRVWYLDEIRRWQSEVDGRGRGRRHRPTRPKS
jgi:prophage regulatory protein